MYRHNPRVCGVTPASAPALRAALSQCRAQGEPPWSQAAEKSDIENQEAEKLTVDRHYVREIYKSAPSGDQLIKVTKMSCSSLKEVLPF